MDTFPSPRRILPDIVCTQGNPCITVLLNKGSGDIRTNLIPVLTKGEKVISKPIKTKFFYGYSEHHFAAFREVGEFKMEFIPEVDFYPKVEFFSQVDFIPEGVGVLEREFFAEVEDILEGGFISPDNHKRFPFRVVEHNANCMLCLAPRSAPLVAL